MNPIKNIIEQFFAKKKVLGKEQDLIGLAKADALLGQLVNDHKVPGLAITVLKNGETFFQKGYGFIDLNTRNRVNAENTVFRIASVSKPLAATALAHMVSEKLIDLDASFYVYVPYFPKKKWGFTIRQLAGHTAGIRGYRGIEYGLNKKYGIREGIEVFKDDDLLFEPGTEFLYNSFGWVLISLAMQEVSGIPFEDYVSEKVLQPLGLNKTFAPNLHNAGSAPFQEDENLQLSKFYSKCLTGFREAIEVNNFYKLAGGGYLSTTSDLAKFGQAYLDGQVLDHDILNQFLTPGSINKTSTYYGLGWQVSRDSGGRNYYGHVGNGVGGYSNFFVYPKEQMVFAILTNCTDPKIQNTLDDAIEALLLA
ncbi:MAG: D-alanyl-D-alanine carboxypeptidase [Pseudozobellia sp.]|nr:D-alanyl-D-alanine carboxypeptidase [Pseudozobellia sp.]MBG47089.1 D-alanyl-D-alanine carboxypeptidase [Pseudozobellia sp.]|tara:strand:- start:134224 stop:135318 length:1095 start_codon:yes stop_codon:yes gene_type:complete